MVWILVGGELLIIEVVVVKGKGKFIIMGLFGDVMKELIIVVMIVVCICVDELGIELICFEEIDVYVYLLEGVILKDGFFVGLVLIIVLVFVFIGILICFDIVMIGEISFGGCVMCIGGLKEKFLVVYCGGIKLVFIF